MLIVVGGQVSKIGKTSVIVAILSRFRQFQWTAVKTTQHLHRPASCEPVAFADDWRLWKQTSASSDSDTARFLAAGAKTALLLEASNAAIPAAAAALQREITACSHVIIESSRIMEFIDPDLFLMLLSAVRKECKTALEARIRQAHIILLEGDRMKLPGNLQTAMKQKSTFELSIPIREDELWMNAIAANIGTEA